MAKLTETVGERNKRLAKTKAELDRGTLFQLTNESIIYLRQQLAGRKITRKEKIDIAKTIVSKAFPKDFTVGTGTGKGFTDLIKELHKSKPVVIQNNVTIKEDKESKSFSRVSFDVTENKEK